MSQFSLDQNTEKALSSPGFARTGTFATHVILSPVFNSVYLHLRLTSRPSMSECSASLTNARTKNLGRVISLFLGRHSFDLQSEPKIKSNYQSCLCSISERKPVGQPIKFGDFPTDQTHCLYQIISSRFLINYVSDGR